MLLSLSYQELSRLVATAYNAGRIDRDTYDQATNHLLAAYHQALQG